jgi:predicted nucleotide-binding protein
LNTARQELAWDGPYMRIDGWPKAPFEFDRIAATDVGFHEIAYAEMHESVTPAETALSQQDAQGYSELTLANLPERYWHVLVSRGDDKVAAAGELDLETRDLERLVLEPAKARRPLKLKRLRGVHEPSAIKIFRTDEPSAVLYQRLFPGAPREQNDPAGFPRRIVETIIASGTDLTTELLAEPPKPTIQPETKVNPKRETTPTGDAWTLLVALVKRYESLPEEVRKGGPFKTEDHYVDGHYLCRTLGWRPSRLNEAYGALKGVGRWAFNRGDYPKEPFLFEVVGPTVKGIEEVRYAELHDQTRLLGEPQSPDPRQEKPTVTIRDPKRVFVVYGRNKKAYEQVVLFLRALKLDPVPFSEVTASAGGAPYLGDVLKKGMADAQAIVVLLTPDERATLVTGKLARDKVADGERLQARPNVIFEAGMALGAHENKTIVASLGSHSELFSDILGRHIVHLNNSDEAREMFWTRLKGVGCAVDKDASGWHSKTLAGDFESCIEQDAEAQSPPTAPALPQAAPNAHPLLTTRSDVAIAMRAWLARLTEADMNRPRTYESLDQELHMRETATRNYLAEVVKEEGTFTIQAGENVFTLSPEMPTMEQSEHPRWSPRRR